MSGESRSRDKILVLGAAGHVGGVGRTVTELLLSRGFPVRAFVHREDNRSASLRDLGADVFIGDLTRPEDVTRAFEGCRRVYFGMGVSDEFLEAILTAAVVARNRGDIEVFVNISQMTVAQMDSTHSTDSSQQRQHWLSEQVLNWSGLPVVHVRPTVFMQHFFFTSWAAESIKSNSTVRLPFHDGKSSPVDARDVAEVAVAILTSPTQHIGRTYHLTGPNSFSMSQMAGEYSKALHKPISYVDVPYDLWFDEVQKRNLPIHVRKHLTTMAKLHASNRYDRSSTDVETLLGRPPTSFRSYLETHSNEFEAVGGETKKLPA